MVLMGTAEVFDFQWVGYALFSGPSRGVQLRSGVLPDESAD
jgi:hypothetical protein